MRLFSILFLLRFLLVLYTRPPYLFAPMAFIKHANTPPKHVPTNRMCQDLCALIKEGSSGLLEKGGGSRSGWKLIRTHVTQSLSFATPSCSPFFVTQIGNKRYHNFQKRQTLLYTILWRSIEYAFQKRVHLATEQAMWKEMTTLRRKTRWMYDLLSRIKPSYKNNYVLTWTVIKISWVGHCGTIKLMQFFSLTLLLSILLFLPPSLQQPMGWSVCCSFSSIDLVKLSLDILCQMQAFTAVLYWLLPMGLIATTPQHRQRQRAFNGEGCCVLYFVEKLNSTDKRGMSLQHETWYVDGRLIGDVVRCRFAIFRSSLGIRQWCVDGRCAKKRRAIIQPTKLMPRTAPVTTT